MNLWRKSIFGNRNYKVSQIKEGGKKTRRVIRFIFQFFHFKMTLIYLYLSSAINSIK